VLLKAPAKINLTLRVLAKRADGYHEISSLMRAIRLFDEVGIDLAPGGEPHISLHTNMPGVPEGSGNLAYRAAGLALETWGREAKIEPMHDVAQYIDITIKKQIPMSAGLGGGSADAAAVMLALAKELKPEARLSEIAALGAKLGADVPVCVYSCAAANPELGYEGAGAAIAEGVGEQIGPIIAPERGHVLLVKPSVGTRSGDVYALYDEMREAMGDSGTVFASENDLEAPCAKAWPIVADVLSTLRGICGEENANEAKVQLSGSGPTVFAYFDCNRFGCDQEAMAAVAERVYDHAIAAFPGMFVQLTETI